MVQKLLQQPLPQLQNKTGDSGLEYMSREGHIVNMAHLGWESQGGRVVLRY
jgi:hypothetical protein